MPQCWENLRSIFSSLLEGTLLQNLDKFTDQQLKPFLPLLVQISFGSPSSPEVEKVTSRVVAFPDGNRILQLLQTSNEALSGIEADLKTNKPFPGPFRSYNDWTKIQCLLHSLIYPDQREDKILVDAVSSDHLEEAILLLQIAYLRLPHLFNLEKIIIKVITIENAYNLVVGLVSTAPELFQPVLSLVKAIQVSDECARGRQRSGLLDLLFTLCPNIVWPVIEDMATSRRDCMLAVRLAAVHIRSDQMFLSFLCSQLIHRDSDTVASQTITKQSSRSTLNIIYDRLIRIGKQTLKSNPENHQTDVIRLMVFLQQHCQAKLNADQLSLFTPLLCRTVGDHSHILYTVSVIMSLQYLTVAQTQAGVMASIDEKIPQYFKWLREIVQERTHTSLIPPLMYIAACVYSNKKELLNSMFSELLRIKISIQQRHLDVLASLMQENFFKSEEIAQQCVNLPITRSLNANSGSRLPIDTIYHCFVKHGIDITLWLENQLQSCTYPIHGLLPELIERFAAMATSRSLPGLSKQFVNAAFDGEILDEKAIPVRILTFLFLLSYRSNLDQLGSKAIVVHGSDTFTKLPARYLLSIVMSRTKDFEPIQAPLTRLATDICPYMLPTVDSVIAVRRKSKAVLVSTTQEELLHKLKTTNQIENVVNILHSIPVSDKVNCIKVTVQCFIASLDNKTDTNVIESIVALYKELQNFVPRVLVETSAMEWLGGSKATLLLSDIYEYPALLFRCDRRILSSPQHFQCFIDVLDFFIQASKNNLHRKIHAANVLTKNDIDRLDRESLSAMFDNTQISFIIQLLIEISDETKMKDDFSDGSALLKRRRIRELACAYIHQMLIGDPLILKFVLFQGLPLHMINNLVNEIPSMFVAIDHMQELLTHPDMNRRVCAVNLMVALSRKYRIITSFNMTDFILNILNTLFRYAESFINIKLFVRIVPKLAEIISIFPQLSGDVTALLLKVSAMAKSRLALQPLTIRPNCEEQRLMNLVAKSLSEQTELQEW